MMVTLGDLMHAGKLLWVYCCDCEFARLRRMCLRWASDSVEWLAAHDPQVPEALSNRSADNWRGMLSVADAAGGKWPKRARDAALKLSGVKEDDDPSVELLKDIRTIFVREWQVFGGKGVIFGRGKRATDCLISVEDARDTVAFPRSK